MYKKCYIKGLFCINFKIMDFVTEPVDPHSELGYAPWAIAQNFLNHDGPQSRILLWVPVRSAEFFNALWAKVGIDISLYIGDIQHRHLLFPYRKKKTD